MVGVTAVVTLWYSLTDTHYHTHTDLPVDRPLASRNHKEEIAVYVAMGGLSNLSRC